VTCKEFIEFVWRYLDEELPAEQRAVFEEHLVVCHGCVNYLAGYAETVRLTGHAFEDPNGALPEDVPEELVAAILAASKPS
jgi:predicted anti-sigma-YlaC factor YlaD